MSARKKLPAMEAALGSLARRERSAAEMRAYLRRKGYGADEIPGVLARLHELGYLDDARYALGLATRLAADKAWGPRRVRQELARRGVAGEIVEQVMKRAEEEGAAPAGNLERALAKLIRLHGAPKGRKDRERIWAALLRRGFAPGDISGALAALDAAADDDRWEQT
jgi:regulatory protein